MRANVREVWAKGGQNSEKVRAKFWQKSGKIRANDLGPRIRTASAGAWLAMPRRRAVRSRSVECRVHAGSHAPSATRKGHSGAVAAASVLWQREAREVDVTRALAVAEESGAIAPIVARVIRDGDQTRRIAVPILAALHVLK